MSGSDRGYARADARTTVSADAATVDERPATDLGESDRPETDAVLSVEGLRKEFEGVVALDSASLNVREGEIIPLVGPNGAGKTTLFNCVMGVHEPTGGRVHLRSDDVTELSTADLVNRGVSRTFQIPRVFPELSVYENIAVSQDHRDEELLSTLYRSTDEDTEAEIDQWLSFVGLDSMVDNRAGELSTGQQKLLNIAATLLSGPEIILLDEPTAGVNPGLVDDIVEMLHELNDRGQTFLVIEHEMEFVREVSDHIYVLAEGTNLVDGEPEAALSDPRVLESYFGR